MNAIAELKRLPETKEQVQSFAYAVINEIMDGDNNPVEVEVRLKMIEESIKIIRKDPRIKNLLVNEIESGNTQAMGATLNLKTRKTLKYHDPILDELKGKVKAREALLKETKGIDPETGEVVVEELFTEYIEIKLK